jgi:hypothetical protein
MKMLILTVMAALLFVSVGEANGRWGLTLKANTIASMTAKGVGGWGTYLYMVATITNPTDETVPLSLRVNVGTDVPNMTLHGSLDPLVRKAVEARLGRKLEGAHEIAEIEAGESVEVIYTFGKLDVRVDTMTFDVVGLLDRVYMDNGKTKVQDTALRIHASRRGDELYRQKDRIRIGKSEWVALAPPKEIR